MTQHNTIKLFEEKKVRAVWDDKECRGNLDRKP